MTIRIASTSLVVLAGPSGAGKSTWAARWFRPNQVVSSDDLRAVVGEDEHDQRASTEAFELLDAIVERRLARGLLTVVDTLGMDAERNQRWLDAARRHGRPTVLVGFDTDPKTCRSRNRARVRPVPAKVLTGQLDRWHEVADSLGDDFDATFTASDADVAVVPERFVQASDLAARQADDALPLTFGLHVSRFDWPGENQDVAGRLAQIAVEAEEAGFESLWVMDHFVQIPQVGREWEPMLESYVTLGYLAARTTSIQLGVLVSSVTYRNLALVAKLVATLDVLSEGRACCGLGLGWFEREHRAYGYELPDVTTRYELLDDALELLPLMWGPGAPAFEGRHISTPEALCYPRPIQDHVPILIGGSGEHRTLRRAAKSADACNLFGEPDRVRHLVSVLHQHCADLGRDPADVRVTHLSNALSVPSRSALASRIDELKQAGETAENYAARANAGTTEDHIGRYREFAEAGVQTAIVSLADVGHEGAVRDFGEVIAAFR